MGRNGVLPFKFSHRGSRGIFFDEMVDWNVHIQDLACEEKREGSAGSGDWLVGDGSVDSYGYVADKRRTGGWRAAPLIFGDYAHSVDSMLTR